MTNVARKILRTAFAVLTLCALGVQSTQAQQRPPYVQDPGWIKLVYDDVDSSKKTDEQFEHWVQTTDLPRLVENFARSLRAFPRSVREHRALTIHIGPCTIPNAQYDDAAYTITICNQLAYKTRSDYLAKGNPKDPARQQQAFEIAKYVLYFVLYHELAHALIRNRDLPFTGSEEGAADEFAALVFAKPQWEAPAAAAAYALAFLAEGARKHDAAQAFAWDEHPIGTERAEAIFCVLYSAGPDRFAYLEKPPYSLSPRYGSRCLAGHEYQHKVSNWHRLIDGAATTAFAHYLF